MKMHVDEVGVTANLKTDAELGILAYHGRNGSPEAMTGLIAELGWQSYAQAIPRAANKTWYPDKFMAPIEINRDHLDSALEVGRKYHEMLLNAGVKNENIIIMGFSQGACLASQYALMNPAQYKAIAILTGGYVGQEGIDWGFSGDFSQTPVYLTTSKIDEWVPPSRAEETVNEFDKLNAKVHFHLFEDRTHHISEEEKSYLREKLL